MRPARWSVTFRSLVFALLVALCAHIGHAQVLNVDTGTVTAYFPTTATPVQGVRPLYLQRITALEGSLRTSPGLSAAIAGNPSEDAWRGTASINGVMLATGAYSPTDIDIALPTDGPQVMIGRSYSAVQQTSSPAAMSSNGPNGANWFQLSQPELVFFAGGDDDDDRLYLVLGADRYAEYRRVAGEGTSPHFTGRNGATGVFLENIEETEEAVDTYVLTDARGTTFTFLGFDPDAGDAKGLLWKIVDAANNSVCVGDENDPATTAAAAVADGYEGGSLVHCMYDGSGRRFTFDYDEIDGVDRLVQVKAEIKTGGTWGSPSGLAEVAKVDYSYYTVSPSSSWGEPGDLKQVVLTRHLSDNGITQTLKRHFRYWEGSYHSESNPGYAHALKYVFDFEGVRRFDWNWNADHSLDDDHLAVAVDDETYGEALQVHAAAYFEYDTNHRIRTAIFNGSCGCGGGSNGELHFTYGTLGTPDPDVYQPEAALRTVVERPDGSFLTQFFDETGQPLTQVISEGDPTDDPAPEHWVTGVTRDEWGCVTMIETPANCTLFDNVDGTYTPNSPKALVHHFARVASDAAKGFLESRSHSIGSEDDQFLDEVLAYDIETLDADFTDAHLIRPVVTSRKVFPTVTQDAGDGLATTYEYSAPWLYTDLVVEAVEITPPIVDAANNGSDAAVSTKVHFRKDGLVDFELRPFGDTYTLSYKGYTNGQVSRQIADVDTADGDVIGEGGDFVSDGLQTQKETAISYTPSGLKDETTPMAGGAQKVEKTYITRLGDQRLVQLDYAAVGAGEFYGPVQYRVLNQAGKVEASGVIAVVDHKNDEDQATHIDEDDADPISAVDTGSAFGSLAQLTTYLYDHTGTELEEERHYFLLPVSGDGSDGTNYDATFYAYDEDGHRIRTKEPSGTIRRTSHDIFGRTIDQYIGTNDYGSPSGESSGPANMVKTEHAVYDSGSSGKNGLLTSRTLYVEDSTTDQRITNYVYDPRGRRIVELPPSAPYTLTKYDNQNRVVAVAQYSSSSGLDAGDDPTGLATNRMTLHETFYDEMGRVWKTLRHKIDDADGSDDDSLATFTWYDPSGRIAKIDGNELKKTRYDRLGRVTDEFILAKDDDSDYAGTLDVAGDIVLEQRQTRYDPVLDTVTFTATISRKNTDYDTGFGETEGGLDLNDDGEDRMLSFGSPDDDIKGRMQVTGYWYDRTKRERGRCNFGTNDDATLDFTSGLGDPPASNSTHLTTLTTYNTDGTIDTVTDPMDHVTKYVYDAMGRKTKEIRHYNSGVNSGNPYGSDDNVTVAYAYVDGLRTTLTADTPGTDQVTTYTYGTTKGASAGDSKIATGHLLQKVTYPDSSSGTDVVTHAYNAQSQEIWKKDQAGNIYQVDFDTRGRMTQRRVTTLNGAFDGAVRRIATTYDYLGRTDLVTQYDNATVGSGSVTDEVKYTYNDWGLVEKFEQDRDGVVGGGGDYEVSYSYSGVSTGRNAIIKSQMVLPGGDYVGFAYLNTGGIHDLDVGRVTCLFNVNQVRYAQYSYNGVAQVVDTDYWEPDVRWRQYSGSGTTATYPDLDQFNRVIHSRWSRYAVTPTDFYSVDLSYDENSNILTAEDNVHTGFDVIYTMDDVDRLVEAKEGPITWSGPNPSISSPTRDQQWTLSHTGNWDLNKVDLNGDLDFADSGEENDTRTYNAVNEITEWNSGNVVPDYDPAGNLTDDKVDYEYEWDAFYRLRKVKNTSSHALVAEYRYNGLGYRIGEHIDTDTDNDVDGSDLWYYDAYDENWRQVARFRSSDTSPKEQFVAHQAGLDGRGGGSYIDLVACRNKDKDTAWTTASDTVLEERVYYCQNWRADVSALVKSDGKLVEWVKYSAYGVPFGLPNGDSNSDGDCDSGDSTQISAWSGVSYEVRGDIDLDGDVDGTDVSLVQTGVSTGTRVLSSPTNANVRGNSGRLHAIEGLAQVRTRFLNHAQGSWLSRDFAGYIDGLNCLGVLAGRPIATVDPMGLSSELIASSDSHEIMSRVAGTDPGLQPESQSACKGKCVDGVTRHLDLQIDSLQISGCNGATEALIKGALYVPIPPFFSSTAVEVALEHIQSPFGDGTIGEMACPHFDPFGGGIVPWRVKQCPSISRGIQQCSCDSQWEDKSCTWPFTNLTLPVLGCTVTISGSLKVTQWVKLGKCKMLTTFDD